ncbi:MAG: site-specific DNA-methyltransferase, partial [Aquificaceae bacterium]|nr:site-specific DNA-methyltransferase [Aquificaceae bacterium]MDW8237839.1 site-specific DNA-methyltransferase [Aquificaceae bacterium]
MSQLFQFDTSDLDFGVYRILNYKREHIKKFIYEDLKNKVDQAFAHHKSEKLEEITQKLEKVKEQITKTLGESAFKPTGELDDKFKDTPLGQEFLKIKTQKEEVECIED